MDFYTDVDFRGYQLKGAVLESLTEGKNGLWKDGQVGLAVGTGRACWHVGGQSYYLIDERFEGVSLPISKVNGLQPALDAKLQASDLASYATDEDLVGGLALKLDKAGGTIQGNLVIQGILNVQGGQAVMDVSTYSVEDPLIELGSGQQTGALDGGFLLNRGSHQNVAFFWDESLDVFQLAYTNSTGTDQAVTPGSLIELRAKLRWSDLQGVPVHLAQNYYDSRYLRTSNWGANSYYFDVGNRALVFSHHSTDNIDHIRNDDTANAFHFVNDQAFGSQGNSSLYAGAYYANGVSVISSSGTIDWGRITNKGHGHAWSEISGYHMPLSHARVGPGTIASGKWVTIAVNNGSRASARFIITDATSGRHQAVHFYAAHMFGSRNTINVISNTAFSTPKVFGGIRILEGGTYDGALLQVYTGLNTSTMYVHIIENAVSSGWSLKNFVPHGTDPGGTGNYSALTNQGAYVDLSKFGGMATSDSFQAKSIVNSQGYTVMNSSGQLLWSRLSGVPVYSTRWPTWNEIGGTLSMLNVNSLDITGHGNTHFNYGDRHDIYLTYGHTGGVYVRTYNGSAYGSNHLVWHSGNLNPSAFAPFSHHHNSSYYTKSEADGRYYPKSGVHGVSYDKLRVWNSSTYTIGMVDAVTYGWLNDYAMTFSMNNDNDRGFIWRDDQHTKAQGAMSLTTDGRLLVASRLAVGNTSRYFMANGTQWTRHNTPYGYIDFGPANGSWAHIYTDRPSFYLNKPLTVLGNITRSSDASLKADINVLGNVLEVVSSLQGRRYFRKDRDGELETGFVAQEVIDVMPWAVKRVEGKLMLDYEQIIPYLVEAVKILMRK